jgi:hypothetical protein
MGQLPGQLKMAGQQAYTEAEPFVREAGRQITRHGREGMSAENRAQFYEPFPLKEYGYQTPMPEPPTNFWQQAPGTVRTGGGWPIKAPRR